MVRSLARLLDETRLTEIEIEQGGLRVRVARQAAPAPIAIATSESARALPAASAHSGAADPADHPGVVTSPMVGTAYRSPEPGAKPFCEVVADGTVCMGPPPARDSYLTVPALLTACEITGADAVHPGYGFLSENARFAEILIEHDVHFIGPKPQHIRLMGDKIEAKRTAQRLGIKVVTRSEGGNTSQAQEITIHHQILTPVPV